MPSPREVSRALAEIAALLRFSGEERFKADAYEHAAHVVSSLGEELPSASRKIGCATSKASAPGYLARFRSCGTPALRLSCAACRLNAHPARAS
jgi:DNA polymerase/3'-5' exonuclease PolX